ncbi:MAG: hypothetical protein LBU66_03425 [Treponema sp.]|jgi:hypothetical protein|nr:hypothetical protein [Treponema sp.]
MVIKKQLPVTILFITLLFFVPSVHAQDAQSGDYFINIVDGRPRIFQRLAWDKDEYTLHYEILVERKTIEIETIGGFEEFFDEPFEELHKETTKDTSISISLPPGKYRYRITPYDLLGRRGESSNWISFEIITAYRPTIERFVPDAFFLDRRDPRTLDITGSNLFKESEIYLVNEGQVLIPTEVIIISSERARLVFNDQELVAGSYDIYVKNPGGMEARKSGFDITYKKAMDIFLKIAWVPIIPIYGELLDNSSFDMHLSGIGFFFEAIASKRSTFNGGLELGSVLYTIDSVGPDMLCAEFDLNIALQKRFNYYFSTTFRFGFGITSLFGNGDDGADIVFNLNLSACALILLSNNFYLETGVDFSHIHSTHSSGIIKPRLGIVWKF